MINSNHSPSILENQDQSLSISIDNLRDLTPIYHKSIREAWCAYRETDEFKNLNLNSPKDKIDNIDVNRQSLINELLELRSLKPKRRK